MRFFNTFKNTGKFCVLKFLEPLVRFKLKRTRPKIIGITGSFGKTSTKEAVYSVLKTRWSVYRSPKSLNTEIGLLLSILEQPSGFSSPLKWIKILAGAFLNALFGKAYDFLVLEYGADKPGDIQYLISVVKPDIAILTHISSVHQAEGQFKNEEEVFNEKKHLALGLNEKGIAILNADDKFIKTLDGKLKSKIFWFNSAHGIHADGLKDLASGFSATIHMGSQNESADFKVPGTYHVDIFLPALLCGILNGISLKEGLSALKSFQLPPGRMSIIQGRHGSTILDGSYNASPETVKQALILLKNFPGKRKIAVIGNMNELGKQTEAAHREIAREIGDWLDELIAVGELAHITADECLKKGFPRSKIKILLTPEEAGEYLNSKKLTEGDVILFKGSQNRVRLERAIKMMMADPAQAKNLLCRQEPEWQKIN